MAAMLPDVVRDSEFFPFKTAMIRACIAKFTAFIVDVRNWHRLDSFDC
jgi:hypothetical protein